MHHEHDDQLDSILPVLSRDREPRISNKRDAALHNAKKALPDIGRTFFHHLGKGIRCR
jgi:hypothetical protein